MRQVATPVNTEGSYPEVRTYRKTSSRVREMKFPSVCSRESHSGVKFAMAYVIDDSRPWTS